MVFNKSGRKLNINCTFGKDKVPMATSYTYLGTILTPSGSFNINKENLYNKGLRTVFSILRDLHPQYGTHSKIILKLFDSLVRPILLYNCQVWGTYSKQFKSFSKFKDNLFQVNLCKMILGVNSKTTNSAIRSELGRFPLHISIYNSITNFFLSSTQT